MGLHGNALKKQKFLKAYATAGTVLHACEESGVSRRSVYHWIKKDKSFLSAYEHAQEEVVESLEREAMRRAKDGVAQPVFQMGQQVGTIQKYSDILLIFLLKAMKPEKYRDSHDAEFGKAPHADREEVLKEIHGKLARLAPTGPAPEVFEKPER